MWYLLAVVIPFCTIARADSNSRSQSREVALVVHIDFMPPTLKQAEAPLRDYLAVVRKEAGLIDARLLQQTGAPNHFTLVEIWTDQRAFDRHQSGSNLRKLRNQITSLLGAPWDERVHSESLRFGK